MKAQNRANSMARLVMDEVKLNLFFCIATGHVNAPGYGNIALCIYS